MPLWPGFPQYLSRLIDRFVETIPEPLLKVLGSEPVGSGYAIRSVAADRTHAVHEPLQETLRALPCDIVAAIADDPRISFVHEHKPEADKATAYRIEAFARIVDTEMQRRRLASLAQVQTGPLRAPYDHAALRGVSVDPEQLVPVEAFDIRYGTLARNRHLFYVFPTDCALNSSYWFTQLLLANSVNLQVRLRLDPFLLREGESGEGPFYRMLVYAPSLNWDIIACLAEELHGKWISDPDVGAGCRYDATEFVWSPRPDGVHFVCEELPRADLCRVRGSRYFHSIYDRSAQVFTHVDGGIRVYRVDELAQRVSQHVRNAGKSGCRAKVFRAEGPMDRDTWCNLVACFFVWNTDVEKYFSGEEAP